MMTNRRSRRSPVLLAATIELADGPVPVRMRNLSETGALIEGDRLPGEGETTVFCRNELRVSSRVVWVQGRYAGVAFDQPLSPDQVLRNIPKPRSKPQIEFKRPGLSCRPLTAYERRMIESWMTSLPIDRVGD